MNAYSLFGFQLLAHAGFVLLLVRGDLKDIVLTVLMYFLTGCLGMSVTYHRLLAHRSWVAPKWFEYVGSLLGTLGGTGSTIAWVGAHRKHHRFSDAPGDPHSPHVKPWWWVQWFSMFEPVQLNYVKDLLRSPWHNGLHRGYFQWHALYALVLGFTLGWWYLIPLWLAPAALLWNAGSMINTVCHMYGTHTWASNDRSTNVWWLGILVWGEGYHNNHHQFPNSPKFGLFPHQYDTSYSIIRLLRVRN